MASLPQESTEVTDQQWELRGNQRTRLYVLPFSRQRNIKRSELLTLITSGLKCIKIISHF